MWDLTFLDGWLYYKDPTLPPLSSIASLFLVLLASSSLIAIDIVGQAGKVGLVKKSIKAAEMPEFTSVSFGLSIQQVKFTLCADGIKIAMIGCGSMGGGLALLFAENGVKVSLSDPSEEIMDGVVQKAEKEGYHDRVHKFKGTVVGVRFTGVSDTL